jgi:hypothetical protein
MWALTGTAVAFVCPPAHHHHVVARGRRAVAYEAPDSEGEEMTYACSRDGHRGYLLGFELTASSRGVGGIESITLAGPVIAYDEADDLSEDRGSSNIIYVRNLVTGRLIHKLPTGPTASSGGLAPKIVVKTDGAAAWVNGASGLVHEVYAVDRHGRRLLDGGSGIEPHSLQLHGSTISWIDDGTRKTAPLD